ncbi:TPA: helix-turn-helix domain-containing protein [Enterobacter mori]|nr:helix-turn-helix domain-containing protein [Enterobacter mori]HDR2836725.1 helix-turn-helix domain-containing protein [Enterobacter mori]
MVWYKACVLAALKRKEVSLATLGVSSYTTITPLGRAWYKVNFFHARAIGINPELIRPRCYSKSLAQGLHSIRIKHSKELR